MAITAADLKVRLSTEGASAVKSDLAAVGGAVEQTGQRGNRLTNILSNAFGVAGGIGLANLTGKVFDLGGSFIMANANAETFQNQLVVATGNAAKAQQIFADMMQFAKDTPFEFPELIQGAANLEALGQSSQLWMPIIADTSAATNKSIDQTVQAILDAQTGEFERLKEFGIRSKVEGDKVKFTFMQNGQEMVVEAENTAEGISAALMGIWDQKYDGAMEVMSNTFMGKLATLKDNIGLLMQDASKPLFDFAKSGLSAANMFFDKFAALREYTGVTQAAIKALSAVISTYLGKRAAKAFNDVVKVASVFVSAIRDVTTAIKDLAGPHLESILAGLAGIAALFAGAMAWSGLIAVITGIGAAIAFLLSPLGLLIAAAAALGVAWSRNWGDIQGKTAAVVDWFMSDAWPHIQEFASNVTEAARNIWDQVSPVLTLLGELTRFLASEFFVPALDWAQFILPIIWDDIVGWDGWDTIAEVLDWAEFITPIAWDTFITILDWAEFIAPIVWDTFVTLLDWAEFVTPIVWDTFITTLGWLEFIAPIAWDTFVTVLGWAEFILPIAWDTFVTALDWTISVAKLAWETFVSVMDWTAFVGALWWDTFVTVMDWTAFVGTLLWETFVGTLGWADFIADILWGDFVPGISWSSFIPSLEWPSKSEILNALTFGLVGGGEDGPDAADVPINPPHGGGSPEMIYGGGFQGRISLPEIDLSGLDSAKATLSEIRTDFATPFDVSAVTSGFSQIIAAAMQFQSVQAIVQATMTGVTAAFTSGMATSRAAVSTGVASMTASVVAGMAAFRAAVTSGMASAVAAIRSGIASMTGAIRSAAGSWRSAGADAIGGLVAGVRGGLGALQAVVNQALAIMAQIPAMGRSPWPSMIDAGHDAMDGLIIGNLDRMPKLASTIADVIDLFDVAPKMSAQTPAFVSPVTGGYGAGSGSQTITNNVTVTVPTEIHIPESVSDAEVLRILRINAQATELAVRTALQAEGLAA